MEESSSKIIVLVGPPGSGKSRFIDCLSQQTNWANHRLRPDKHPVRSIKVKLNQHTFVLVDTPGFHESSKSAEDVLEDVNSWLKQNHKKDKVTGILYLQNILDNRLTIPPPLRILNALFGDQAAERIIFVTTHWDRVDTALGEAREAEMRHPLQALLSAGARTARLDMRKHSAWGIIQSLFPDLEGEEEYKRRLVEKRERREAEAKERRRIQEEVDGWGEWQGMDTEPPEQHIRPEGAGSDDRKEEDFETKEEADVRRLEAQNDECQDELEENTRNRNSEEVSVKVEQEATPTVDENVEEEARQEGQETEKSRWGTELQNRPAVMLPKQKRSRLFFTCCCRMM